MAVQDDILIKTYAVVVWRPRVEKVKARNLLKSLQGSYLRAAIK